MVYHSILCPGIRLDTIEMEIGVYRTARRIVGGDSPQLKFE